MAYEAYASVRHVVAAKGTVDDVRQCLDRGFDIDGADVHGRTALFSACRGSQIDTATLLLERGADVDKADRRGATPLYVVSEKGNAALATMLLERGADVTRADNNGKTSLYVASTDNHVEVVNSSAAAPTLINPLRMA